MTKRRENDPELDRLLRAFREVHPGADEMERWRTAVAGELRERSAPPKPVATPAARNVYRLIAKIMIPVAAAAGLGFVVGAAVVERRVDQGQAMLFSLTEPSTRHRRPPTTMDEEREVVRIDLDAGDSR